MADRFAILLDGGFVKKKLKERSGQDPKAAEIVAMTNQLVQQPRLVGLSLLRVYYYDAPPFDGKAKNPLDSRVTNFAITTQARDGKQLLETLELEPDFAVRRGNLMMSGWKMGRYALKSHAQASRPLAPRDLVPDISQKGVDLRIGLDIALMALKHLVEVLVLVTGDSDLVPAMKFARKEGLRVYLDAMGHGIRRELRVHADFVL